MNSVPISGATAQVYYPTLTGTYTVRVTAGGCASDPSNEIAWIFTALEFQKNNIGLDIYPSPASNTLTVNVSAFTPDETLEAELYDLQGRMLESFQESNKEFQIDVSKYLSGIYILKVICGKKIQMAKFSKR
jgi:hypothetical protein